MSQVEIGARLTMDPTGANQAVGSFKKQLRDAQEELLVIQSKFGEFSQEAANAAKKVAELRDRIGDSRSLVDAFNPDRKFAAFAQSVNGVLGGFTALQGVMGLVGAEGEEVQKMMLKVQSAMAISQGVDQLTEAAQGFKNLGMMVRNSTVFVKANEMANKAAAFSMKLFGGAVDTTSTSFKFLKGAIAATGIGVLVILIGEVVQWFSTLQSAAEKAAKAQQEALDLRSKYAKADLDARIDSINRNEKIDLSYAKKRGASEKEILAIEQKAAQDRIRHRKELQQEMIFGSEEYLAIEKANKEEEAGITIRTNEAIAKSNEKALEARQRSLEKASEASKQERERIQKEREAALKEAETLNKELRRTNAVNGVGGEDSRVGELTRLNQEFADKKAILQAGGVDLINLELWFNNERAKINDKYAKEQKEKEDKAREEKKTKDAEAFAKMIDSHNQQAQVAADNAERNRQIDAALMASKEAMWSAVGQGMYAMGQLAGSATAAGKGLALGQIAIDTAMAISALVRNSEGNPLNMLTGGLAGITQFASGLARIIGNIANAKRLLSSVKGGGSGPTMPSISNTTTNRIQPSQGTQLQGLRGQINAQGNQALRAYVITTDVNNDQEKIARINRAARIG